SGLAAWSLIFFNSLAHPAVMFRRSVLESVGFYPAGRAGGTEDYAIFLEISRRSKLANLPDVLLLYRTWGGNMSHTRWQAQEDDAVRLLRAFAADTLGVDLTVDDAIALRGLSRDQYPADAQRAARVGAIIEQLARKYTERSSTRADADAIRTDAAVRLWLLSAVALRRGSPSASSALAAKAFGTSGSSVFVFGAKALRRVMRLGR